MPIKIWWDEERLAGKGFHAEDAGPGWTVEEEDGAPRHVLGGSYDSDPILSDMMLQIEALRALRMDVNEETVKLVKVNRAGALPQMTAHLYYLLRAVNTWPVGVGDELDTLARIAMASCDRLRVHYEVAVHKVGAWRGPEPRADR